MITHPKLKTSISGFRLFILAVAVIFSIVCCFIDPDLLINILERTVSPDYSISPGLAEEIAVFRYSAAMFALIMIGVILCWDNLPRIHTRKNIYRTMIIIHSAVCLLMFIHLSVLLLHRVKNTYGITDRELQKYMLNYIPNEAYDMYQRWKTILPEDARILLVNHEPPWFASYYLYPRMVFYYQRNWTTADLKNIPSSFLTDRDIKWVINGNSLFRYPGSQ